MCLSSFGNLTRIYLLKMYNAFLFNFIMPSNIIFGNGGTRQFNILQVKYLTEIGFDNECVGGQAKCLVESAKKLFELSIQQLSAFDTT